VSVARASSASASIRATMSAASSGMSASGGTATGRAGTAQQARRSSHNPQSCLSPIGQESPRGTSKPSRSLTIRPAPRLTLNGHPHQHRPAPMRIHPYQLPTRVRFHQGLLRREARATPASRREAAGSGDPGSSPHQAALPRQQRDHTRAAMLERFGSKPTTSVGDLRCDLSGESKAMGLAGQLRSLVMSMVVEVGGALGSVTVL
jgi:hypothetical protein